MARLAPTLLVVALVAGTATAFAITERLKLVRSPILATRIVNKTISPGKSTARVEFRLREADRLTLSIVDGDGDVVRTLVDGEAMPKGRVSAGWDGRDETGAKAPEGTYRPRVHLAEERRTILLPNPIRIDSTAPRVVRFRVRPPAFSPDGDGRRDRVSVLYRFDEPAHALLLVDGERRVRTRFEPVEGKLDWFGVVGGKPLRAGEYELRVVAEDPAGNVSAASAPLMVRVRYVELGRELLRPRAGTRFGVGVSTDAASFRWRFAGGRGTSEPGLLVLRAPRKPGQYNLFVEANGHGARARVIVRRK